MNKRKKIMALFLWSVIFSVMFISSGFSEEALQYATGYRKDLIDWSHIGKYRPVDEKTQKDKDAFIPVSYDLRKLNRVNKTVGNQNPFETCWAFATLGAMESNYMTQGLTSLGSKPDLSELHLAWFAYKDPANGHAFTISTDKGVCLAQGGHARISTAILSRMSTPVIETFMPYSKAGTNKKKSDSVMTKYVGTKTPSDYFPLALNLKEWLFLGSVSNDNRATAIPDIKEMIIKHGAAQISYYAGAGATSPAGSTTAYFNNSQGEYVNHGVIIVGWDDNFSKTKFNKTKSKRPKNNGAWIVKNSWGKDWGNNGYFYMSYEQYIANVSLFIAEEPKTNEKVYYHDALGLVDTYGYNDNTAYSANVFKATRNEGIHSIGVYATDDYAQYEIYIVDDLGTKKPSSPVSGDMEMVAYGTFVNAGYHKVELHRDIFVKKNHYFSVIVKMTTPNYNKPLAIECVENGYSEEAVINSKESYFSKDMKKWTDGTKIKNDKNQVMRSNACIKVFTFPSVTINATNFPDEKFRDIVLRGYDLDGNGYLTDDEINSATRMYINKYGISNLKGIERFTALEKLECNNNNLTSLDLKKNTALVYLSCTSNKLTKLDVSKNTALETLECGSNQIKTLTLGRKPALKILVCNHNWLTKLDLIGCPALEGLYCYVNDLKTLTLGQLNSLLVLDCDYNYWLTKLDVTGCPALRELRCVNNQIKSLTLTKNTYLEKLYCENNQLTKLDLSKNVNLYYLYCRGNKITKLDLSRCAVLERIYADNGVTITYPLRMYLNFYNGIENEDYVTYSGYKSVSGGTAPYKWKKTGILPSGLKLMYSGDNKEYATLSGKPKKAGTYTFTLTVTDAKKVTCSKEITITIYPAKSNSSKTSQRDSSQNYTNGNDFNDVGNFETVENETHGHETLTLTPATLKISSDDILWQGSGRDEDLVKVKADSPVKFIIGDWLKPDGTNAKIFSENIQIFVDDNVVEGIEISDEKIFILPSEFVHDDFKIGVKAKIQGSDFESEELYISTE